MKLRSRIICSILSLMPILAIAKNEALTDIDPVIIELMKDKNVLKVTEKCKVYASCNNANEYPYDSKWRWSHNCPGTRSVVYKKHRKKGPDNKYIQIPVREKIGKCTTGQQGGVAGGYGFYGSSPDPGEIVKVEGNSDASGTR